MSTQIDVRCVGCHKTPEEIQEYVDAIVDAPCSTPTEFVKNWDGTYNPKNGHFACTECYIAMGQPVAPGGWRAP